MEHSSSSSLSIIAERVDDENQKQTLQNSDDKGTSFLRTCFNGLNTLSGVGILSVPYALSEGGWLSIITLLLIAIVCCYTGLLLQRCMNSSSTQGKKIRTYPDIGELAFGQKGKFTISIFMYLELYLVAVEFLILEGDNLHKLFPHASLHIGCLKLGAKQAFVLLVSLLILPTTWLRSLGLLAYVSAGGVLASLVLVCCMFWIGVEDGFYHHDDSEYVWRSWGGFLRAMSLFTFCYCGHAVFPSLCNSMKDRTQFPKVLILCFVASTLSYGSMAVLGYLMYGQHVQSQVTLNLPSNKISTKIAIWTTIMNPITKYAIVVAPIATAIEDAIPLSSNIRPVTLLIRTCLVISTVIVALTFPLFGEVMAFIGAFLSVAMSFLFPCLCYLKINTTYRRFGVELCVIVVILVFGSLIALMGTYISLRDIFYCKK